MRVQPEKWTRQDEPELTSSTELYLAGKRESFTRWARELDVSPAQVSDQIRRVENVRAPGPYERIRGLSPESIEPSAMLFEIVLHASDDPGDQYILAAFDSYARSLDSRVHLDRRFHAGGLCFVPVETTPEAIPNLVRFTFLRVARLMPRLRGIPPVERSMPSPELAPSPLPDQDAIDPDLHMAVFDGGLDPSSPFSRWATSRQPRDIGAPADEFMAHGHDVTSAVLFGPLVPGQPARRPFGVIDHYRVLDKNTEHDPFELYDTLRRIDEIIKSRQYQFINLSIGPAVPIEDDEVHA